MSVLVCYMIIQMCIAGSLRIAPSVISYISSVNNQPVPLELLPYDYSAGPSARTKELSCPFEIFQLMFTIEIAEAIVQQSK